MIELAGREPQHTSRAMDSCLNVAAMQGFVPCHFRLGFFNARDLLDDPAGDWRARGAPWLLNGPRSYRDVNFIVFRLEDAVQLYCHATAECKGPLIPIIYQGTTQL